MTWTDADIAADSGAAWDDADIAPSSPLDNPRWGMGGYDAGMGFLKGATTLGASIPQGLMSVGEAILAGEGQEGARRRYEERRANLNQSFSDLADTEGLPFKAGQFGGEIAATAGLGPAQKATPVGAAALEGTARLGRYLANTARGGISGGMQAAAINPDDAALGAGLGAAIPAVLQPMAKAGVNAVGMFTDKIRGDLAAIRAGKMLRDIAGGATDDILRATEANPNLLPGQAAMEAGVQRNPFYALQEMFRGDDAITVSRNAQEAARQRIMGEMAEGSSSQDAGIARDLYTKLIALDLKPVEREILEQVAAPGRQLKDIIPLLKQLEAKYQSALQNQGRMATEAAQQGSLSMGVRPSGEQLIQVLPDGNYPQLPRIGQPSGLPVGAFPVAGMPRVPPRYTPNEAVRPGFEAAASELGGIAKETRAAADALRQQASDLPSAFTAQPIRDAVAEMSQKIGKVNRTVADAVAEELRFAGDDPFKIAELRKLGINQIISDLVDSGKLAKQDAAAALTEVKRVIDGQLGADYVEKYLKPYSAALNERGARDLANELRLLQKESPEQFMKVLRGDNPDLVAKYGDWKTIQEALGESRFATASDVAGEMGRDKSVSEAAQLGAKELDQILKDSTLSARIPNLFSPKITVTNALLDNVEHKLNRAALDQVKIAMRSGADANRILKMFPLNQRNEAAKWIAMGGPARLMTKGVGAVTASPER